MTVQLPSFLTDFWTKAPVRSELGHIRIGEIDPKTGVPPVALHLTQTETIADEGGQPSVVPKNYTIKFTSTPPGNMLVFSQNEDGSRALAIEGSVQHECSVTPVMDDDYRGIMRQRRQIAEKPKRTTQTCEIKGTDQVQNVTQRFLDPSKPAAPTTLYKVRL